MVAGAADEVVEACAFAAENDDAVAGEVEVVVIGGGVFVVARVEANDPEILALELFEGADEIDDTGDAEMLGGAGAGFDGYRAEGGGTALGEDDAVDAGSVGYAEKGAEVLRVFNAVEGEDEAAGAGKRWIGGEQVFDGEEFLGADESNDALMRWSFGEEGELLARLDAGADAGFAAESDDAVEAGVVAFARKQNVVETAPAGSERFLDGMHPVQNFHEG
jgi:hypothetical protein